MKKLLMLLPALLLAACGTMRSAPSSLFDLGPLPPPPSVQALPALPPVSVAEIDMPNWLDRPQMYYRLGYANNQQPRAYSQSRWVMQPSQLIAQRLKARIAQAGGVALPASDGAARVPVLNIEVDDFTQHFDTASASSGRISLRASVFRGRILLAQKTIDVSTPAPTADASGGARALARATDTAIDTLIRWLDTLPLK